ncbi:tripartite tricarboxylate transporter substrate-binding protein [Hydrogenophaga sp. 2FB]|uniref:Bug family tripartite tricarboxylate transporter substrate binding protein n=1 Tax=Hydrogenophaga sp. 2FB TaxID=2502187 RepID=UPI0010F8B843|nr:tripartite tricarboxylate transporter substrate-binding protein [Hydrogenophaga sp. 2FB]
MKPHDIHRRELLVAGMAMGLTSWHAGALAQAARPTQLIVGFPPGGGIDLLARLMASQLRTHAPEPVVVDNKAGVAGRLALEYIKRAPTDGSALLLTPDFPLTIFPHIYKKLAYDPVRDFTAVAACARSELVLSVGPMVPSSVHTVPELVKWLQAHPDKADYASSGPGGVLHLLGVMFSQATGVQMTHVPFRGSAPALQALAGGHVAVSFNAVGEALPFKSSGSVRPLATFGAKRSRYLPDTPCMVELGYPHVQADTWLGVFAPPRMPQPLVDQWNARINSAVNTSDYAASLEKLSMEPVTLSPTALASLVKSDIARWAPIVKASGFTADE